MGMQRHGQAKNTCSCIIAQKRKPKLPSHQQRMLCAMGSATISSTLSALTRRGGFYPELQLPAALVSEARLVTSFRSSPAPVDKPRGTGLESAGGPPKTGVAEGYPPSS